MAYIRSFRTQTTISSYTAGPFTITATPQNIDIDAVTVNTAVKLYRGMLYEKITTLTDDQATIAKLLANISELSEGETGSGGLGGISKVSNVGTASGVWKETVNGDARLKSLRAGANITLNVSDNEIMITGTTPPVSVPIDSIANVGPGSAAGVYKDISGQTARLRRISAGNNVTVIQNADDITINAVIPPIPSQGVTSGQNVGSSQGFGVFKDILSATTARFKRIIPGNNVTISSTDDDITINAVVPTITPATVTNLANTGSVSSVGVFKELTSTVGYFRKLKAGNNATVALDGDDITISAIIPSPSGAQTITNVGTSGAAGVFKQLTGTEAQLRRLKEGSNVSIDVVGDDIVISAVPGEGAEFASGENVGAGEGAVYKNTLGSNLVFRTIKAGDNISIVQNADELVIHAIEGGETTVGGVVSDATAGAQSVINSTVDNIVHLKGVKAGANATVTTVGNDIVIAASPGVTAGSNVGTGEGQVFKQINSETASFKSIKAGDNIVITDDGNTITIEAETGGDVGLTTLTSDGTSGSVAVNNGVTGSTAHFKGIKAGANVTVTGNSTDVTIAASFDGLTSGQNDGDGAGKVFKSVTGGVGTFRSIKAGTGVSISQDSNNIIIDAAGGSSGVTTVINNGSGSGIGMDVTGPVLNLKSIKAGANITVTEAADEIVIGSNMDLTGAITSLVNVDGGGSYDARVFKSTASGVASIRTIKAGSNVTISEGTDVITISASGGSASNYINDGDGVGKVYKSTSGTDVHLRSIKAGSNISIAQDTNNIVISATGGGSGGGGTATGFNTFSAGTSYTAGEVVLRNNQILMANTTISAGPFNAAQWDTLGGGSGYKTLTIPTAPISDAVTPVNGFSNFIPTYDYPALFTDSEPNVRTLNSGQFCWIGGINDLYQSRLKTNDSYYFEISIDNETPGIDRFININLSNKGMLDGWLNFIGLDVIQEDLLTYISADETSDSFTIDARMGRTSTDELIVAHRLKGCHLQEIENPADRFTISMDSQVMYTPDETPSSATQYIGTAGFDKIGVYVRVQPYNGLYSALNGMLIYGYNSTTEEYAHLADIGFYSYTSDKTWVIPIIGTKGYDITVRTDGNWEIPEVADLMQVYGTFPINAPDWPSFELVSDGYSADGAYYPDGAPWPLKYPGDNIANAKNVYFWDTSGWDADWETRFQAATDGHTKEVGEPDINGDPLNVQTVWYILNIPKSGLYEINVPDPTAHEVFSGGPSFGSLVSLNSGAGFTQTHLDVGTYYLALGSAEDSGALGVSILRIDE